jgi:two-component system NtrC family sensor kinase
MNLGVLPKQSRKAFHVLVVDDEPLIARALKRVLQAHTVDVAHDGVEALKKCRNTHYDAIFCDVMMPQMNGLQLLTLLRELYPSMAPRLTFMSGGVIDPKVSNQIAAVANPVVEKPFVPGQIYQALRYITQVQ